VRSASARPSILWSVLLHYPDDAAVLVAGLPGAGKSTLVARAADPAAATVLDTDPLRALWTRRLHPLPYALWRPLMHATHYALAYRALRRPGPVVVAEPGTRALGRRLFTAVARAGGHTVHLLAIDASPGEARGGQRDRGRRIGRRSLARHARRWAAARREVRRERFDTVRMLARSDAARVRRLEFGPARRARARRHGDGARAQASAMPGVTATSTRRGSGAASASPSVACRSSRPMARRERTP
jgi:AAA domain